MLNTSLRHTAARLLLVLTLTVVVTVGVTLTAFADAQVPDGGRAFLAPSGSDAPAAASGAWDIVRAGQVIASAAGAHGWEASYLSNSGRLRVRAPLSATIGAGYEVRLAISGADYSAPFDVVAGLAGVTLKPAGVVGGGSSNGEVRLTGPAPAPGTKVKLTSGSASATTLASVTVPAGKETAFFTVRSVPVQATVHTAITAAYGGVTDSTKLTIHATGGILFEDPKIFPVPAAADSIYAADFDGDGKADVTITDGTSLYILYGNGDGTLQPYKKIYTWSGGL